MRYCIKCKSEMEDDMVFCPECGAKYVFYDSKSYASEGCPIVVLEKAIIIEDDTPNVFIKALNVGTETVNAVSITLKCMDAFGDSILDTNIKINDLNANSDELIELPKPAIPDDVNTRFFDIIVNKIVFTGGKLWKNSGNDVLIEDENYNHLRTNIDNRCSEEKWNLVWSRLQEWHDNYYNIIVKQLPETYKAVRAYIDKVANERQETNYEFKDNLLHEIFENPQEYPEVEKYIQAYIDMISGRNEILNANPDFVIPDGVQKIESWIFSEEYVVDKTGFWYNGQSFLNSITIPSSVTEIEDYAFVDCDKIREINIPDSVIKLGKGIFSKCSSLCNIQIGNSIKSITWAMFAQCSNLEYLVIPDQVEIIEDCAFSNCKSLKKVILPKNLKVIFSTAFSGCSNLIEVRFWSDRTKIGLGGRKSFEYQEYQKYDKLWLDSTSQDPNKQEYYKKMEMYRNKFLNKEYDIEKNTYEFTNDNIKTYKMLPETCVIIFDREIKIKEYLESHPEKRQEFEAQKAQIVTEIANVDSELLRVQKQRYINVPSEIELQKNKSTIDSLTSQLEGLGFFKSKEKKLLQEQIEQLRSKGSVLQNQISEEIAKRDLECNKQINDLEQKKSELNNKLVKIELDLESEI